MTPPIVQDALLIEFPLRSDAIHPLAEALERLAAEIGMPSSGLRAYQALGQQRVTAYFRGVALDRPIAALRSLARERLGRLAEDTVEVSRLEGLSAFAGASWDAAFDFHDPDFHYIVRTDVEPGGESELERWYDEEHMPGLASVPGTVLARRLRSLDAAPRFYACYDLTSPEVLLSAPWLAVRATDWSGRVRPTFRHTRRTMTRRLPGVGV